jgi:molybdenum cofactor biosynthesis enzyme MoaA
MMKDWYDKGEGSEHMKREIAKSAREHPVSSPFCQTCNQLKAKNAKLKEQLKAKDAALQEIIESEHRDNNDYPPIKSHVECLAEQALKGTD